MIPRACNSRLNAMCVTAALATALLGWNHAGLAAPAESAAATASQMLSAAACDGGLIVHVGCGDGTLTAALAGSDTRVVVLGLERRAEEVRQLRQRMLQAKLGQRVFVHAWREARLPLVDNCARLIVVEPAVAVAEREAMRVLCPGGLLLRRQDGTWKTQRKPWPADIDQWTHYLRDASGNAVAADDRVGPPRHMQWLCGPRWMRNHHMLASISAIVSAEGRLFYILDEGPSANMNVPGKWTVVARDAFSGVLLWQRPIPSWVNWRHKFRAGPVQLARLLVASGDRLYCPLGVNAPLTALDAGTGEEIHTFENTEGVEEVLCDSEGLLVVTATPMTAQQTAGAKQPRPAAKGKRTDRRGKRATPYVRSLLAIDPGSGQVHWQWSSDKGNPEPLGLASDGKRVYVQFGEGMICLERATGDVRWQTPGAQRAPRNPRLMSDVTVVVQEDVVVWTDSTRVWALDAADGSQLWSADTQPSLTASNGKIVETRAGFRGPADLFVIDGTVWIGAQFREGRDLRTGAVRRTTPGAAAIQTAGHHHRCYREKATSRFLLIGQRGTEFIDLVGDDHSRNNWVRGVCQYGVLPCNGLLYTPPHACGCYMEAKLNGFWAMAAHRDADPAAFNHQRLSPGPAAPPSVSAPAADPSDWPTFRHDATRSGSSNCPLPHDLEVSWSTTIDGKLTAPVCAAGVVLVGAQDTHQVVALDAGTGERLWDFVAGGRIDSPPTIHQGLVLCGSADGHVYCLRLSDGELVWRFFAAPEPRLTVAMNQLESVWPVHGSVLVQDGVAYFAAGRSSYLDGGIVVYGLDPASGEVRCQTTLTSRHPQGHGSTAQQDAEHPRRPFVQNATDARTFLAPDQSDAFSMEGATNDVLVSNGHDIFLRHLRFDRNLERQARMARHLFSTSQLVDETENHRIHWVLGSGDFSRLGVAYSWQVNLLGARNRYRYKPAVPFGMLLTFDDQTVWGVRRPEGYKGYELTVWPNEPLRTGGPSGPDIRKMEPGEDPGSGEIRVTPLDMRPRSLIRAGRLLVLGGGPYEVSPRDPFAAYEGRLGGLIRLVDAADGKLIAQHELSAPVVWNGLAVARNRLYAATADGRVLCLAQQADGR